MKSSTIFVGAVNTISAQKTDDSAVSPMKDDLFYLQQITSFHFFILFHFQ